MQGKRESATSYGDPLACATRWLDEGADALHVVNLDGAFGNSGKNAELIADLIRSTGVEIELGGASGPLMTRPGGWRPVLPG